MPVLTILDVDPCIGENGAKHRTSRYEAMTRRGDGSRLVVRRGQEFYLHLALSRDYDPNTDGISLVFTVDGAERPQYGHGTLVATPVLYPGQRSEASWQAYIDSLHSDFLRLKVRPPPLSLSPVSLSPSTLADRPRPRRDNRQVEDGHRHEEQEHGRGGELHDEEPVLPRVQPLVPRSVGFFRVRKFLLSDPRKPILSARDSEDAVYMEDEEERQEYVMAEDGLIWRGSYNRPRRTVWKYSQFERDILDCALHLMIEVGRVRISARHDPVVIARVLSAAVSMPPPFLERRCSTERVLSKGELAGRQRGGDGQLVQRFRGWHAAHQVARLAEDTPAVLQD